jgi:hypothetical protein
MTIEQADKIIDFLRVILAVLSIRLGMEISNLFSEKR